MRKDRATRDHALRFALLLLVVLSGVAPGPCAGTGSAHSPRGAVEEYLSRCRAGQFDVAAAYLDLRDIPESERLVEGPILAKRLKVVLDRTLWVDLDKLSAAAEGNLEDGLPPDVDRVGVIPAARGPAEVTVSRVLEGETRVWKVSRSTVGRVLDLYAEFGYGALGDVLPDWCFTLRFLDVELWQWIGLALVALASWPLALVLTSLLRRMLRPIVKRTRTQLDDHIVAMMTQPVRFAFALLFFTAGSYVLKLSVPVHEFLRGLGKGLAFVVVTWILMRVVHVATEMMAERALAANRTALLGMIPLARKTAKVALVCVAAIGLLQGIGFNVTGIVAGLGVGGLAIALAAQRTVENLFGGVTLTTDQPVRVGEFCRWGDKSGIVEDVGLRSTKIRTLDRTVVTVPNSVFSQMEIENFGRRDKVRLHAVIGLRYETSPDQLRHVLIEIRKLLAAHPMIEPEPARVRLVGFGASSLDVEIYAFARTADYGEFLKVREDVYLRIMEIVAASGAGFAFPSQTLYLGRDGGLDLEKARAAEEHVRELRERGALPFPDLPADLVAEIEDRLEFPPVGSAAR